MDTGGGAKLKLKRFLREHVNYTIGDTGLGF